LSWRLVEPPLDLGAARVEAAPDLLVDLSADIDVVDSATHTLIGDGSLAGLAVGLDGDGLAAHGIVVRKLAHQEVGESDNVDRVILASVVLTASTLTNVVVGEFAVLGVRTARGATARGRLGGLLLLNGSDLSLGLRLLLGGLDNRLGGLSGGLRGRSLGGGLNGSDVLRGRLSSSLGLSGGLRSRGRSVDAGDQSSGRGGRRSRLLLLLGSNILGSGLSCLGLRSSSRLGLRSDPDGGGSVDHLGNVLDLSHPLNLGDNIALVVLVVTAVVVSVRVGMGLGDGRSGEEGRSKSERLHVDIWIVCCCCVRVLLFNQGVAVAVIRLVCRRKGISTQWIARQRKDGLDSVPQE